MMIVCEEQAHRAAKQFGQNYTVFLYEQKRTRLTLFGIELEDGQVITTE